MKQILSPKYIERLKHSLLLWFKRSNSYVLLPVESEILFQCYLNSNSIESFSKEVASHINSSSAEISSLYISFTKLIDESNIVKKSTSDFKLKNSSITLPSCHTSIRYQVFGKSIEIKYGSEILKNVFHPQLAHLQTSKAIKPDTTFHIFKESNNYFLLKDNKPIFKSQRNTLHHLQGQFAMELTNLIHQKEDSSWLASFHASTVVNNDKAVMIVGPSGNGKSTLTALLASNGYQLLADDFTPLNAEDLNLYRFPGAISIKSGAFEILESRLKGFSELPTYFNESKKKQIKYISPEKTTIANKHSFPCHQIVFVDYCENCQSEFKVVDEKKILSSLIPDSWLSPEPEHAKKILSWFSQMEYYELRYSDSDYALTSINSLF